MDNYYDMVIIGAGPAGLTLAQCCCNMHKKILIIDRETTIGGCHRVKRVHNGLFTEHGPRMYFSFYVNFLYIISELGLHKDAIFTQYKYDFFKLSMQKILPHFNLYEILTLMLVFVTHLFNNNYGINISLESFCKKHNFRSNTIDIIDRLCRISDGATISMYSVNKFMSIINMFTFSTQALQPKKPLDVSLFPIWQKTLETNNVEFILGQEVNYIHYNHIIHKIEYIVLKDNRKIFLDKLVLAIPPVNMVQLLRQQSHSVQNCFGYIDRLYEWSEDTEYIEYISITYHFKDNIHIPSVNGITLDTDWGLVVINISDYMAHVEKNYAKVISVAITITDKKSRHIHKTANECTAQELYSEVYTQMKQSLYADLPQNYLAILNPNNYYDSKKKKWQNKDEAFFNTVHTNYLPFHSPIIQNIFNLGTQNGHSHVKYTTLESAVSNAMSLACKLYPSLKTRYYLRKYADIGGLFVYILILIFVILLLVTITSMHV